MKCIILVPVAVLSARFVFSAYGAPGWATQREIADDNAEFQYLVAVAWGPGFGVMTIDNFFFRFNPF